MNLNWFNLPLQIGLGIALGSVFSRIIAWLARMVGVLMLVTVATGCGTTPIVDYRHMAPEQIREVMKDKTAVGHCLTANTPYGKGISTYIAIDKSAVAAGGSVTINDQCQITFSNGAPSTPLPVLMQDGMGGFRMVVPPR